MNFLPGRLRENRLYLPGSEEAIDLPAIKGAGPEREVVIGLRPEHLWIVADTENGPLLPVTASIVAWLGADAFVHFDLHADAGGRSFPLPEKLSRRIEQDGKIKGVVRVDPSLRIARGEPLLLKPDTRRLHLFDPENGIRLSRPQGRFSVEGCKPELLDQELDSSSI